MKFKNINDVRLFIATNALLSQTDLDAIESYFDTHKQDIVELNSPDPSGRTFLHHLAEKQFAENADTKSFMRRLLDLKITQPDSLFIHPNAFLLTDGIGKKGKNVLEIASDNDNGGFVRAIEEIIMERFNKINDLLINMTTKKGKPRFYKNESEKKAELEYIGQHTELSYFYWENSIDPQTRAAKKSMQPAKEVLDKDMQEFAQINIDQLAAKIRKHKSENPADIQADIAEIRSFFSEYPQCINMPESTTGNTILHILAKVANVNQNNSSIQSRAVRFEDLLADLINNYQPDLTIKNNMGLTVEGELQRNRDKVIAKRASDVHTIVKKSSFSDAELVEIGYMVKVNPSDLVTPNAKDNNNTLLHELAKKKLLNEYDVADLAHNVLVHYLNQKGNIKSPFTRNSDNKMMSGGAGKTPIDIAIQNGNKPFLLGLQNALQSVLKIKGTRKESKSGSMITDWEIGDTKLDPQLKAQLLNAFLNINTVLGSYSEADLKVNDAPSVKKQAVQEYLEMPTGSIAAPVVGFDAGIATTVAAYLDDELTAEEKEKQMIDILDELLEIDDVTASGATYISLDDLDADVDDKKVTANVSGGDLDELFNEISDSVDMSGLDPVEEDTSIDMDIVDDNALDNGLQSQPKKPSASKSTDALFNRSQQSFAEKAKEVKREGFNLGQQLRPGKNKV